MSYVAFPFSSTYCVATCPFVINSCITFSLATNFPSPCEIGITNSSPKSTLLNHGDNFDTTFVVTNFDYLKALEYYKENNIIFDIVFLDPPYKMEFDFNVISLLKSYNILSDNHIIVIERDSKINDTNLLNYKVKELKYGKTYIYILRSEYENSNLSR